ncbi:MAG: glycosyltransferase [Nitrospirae bacterium]|nr:glycosyltransferase [Nitrospirota bacterium]
MDRSLRILQINSGGGWSGGQYQVLLLSKGLAERGHHVVVVCSPDSALAEKASKAGLLVEPVPMRGQWDLKAVFRLREIMKRHRIEVLNTHKPKPHTLALLAAITARVPVVVATRRVSFPLRRHPFRWAKWVAGVDKIIAVAQSVEESLIRSGVPAEKVVTIYGAIDLKRFRPASPDPALRKELGIDDRTWVVGKVADYRPWKGYGLFLEAASLILKEEPRVRFLAIGNKSDYFDEMQAQARRLAIEKQVTFTGFRDDVERFYPLLHVSVNCATSGEGLPGVLRESLAMEIPVVATDVGGNREVVIDGRTGRLIPSNDPVALAQAILSLLRDRDLARRLGRQGRSFVERQFSIESMVAQTEAVYQSLVRNP